MTRNRHPSQSIDLPTLIGLVLLLAPLLTMGHELGGHGVACLVTGGRLIEIGSHYVNCDSHGLFARRIVALAGSGADVLIALVAYAVWRRATGDLARLALWMIFVDKAMVAAGYPLFSGVAGIGDWAVGGHGGLAPLTPAWAWRAAFAIGGALAYYGVVRLAMATLRTMLGGAPDAHPAQKRVALGLYLTSGISAVLAGLLNPVGLFILLGSAAASSFGGLAGLWTVAYTPPPAGPVRPFRVDRHPLLIGAGVVATLLFALILGPSIRLTA